MKNVIGIGSLVLAVIAVAVFGIWSQKEQSKQYYFTQKQNIQKQSERQAVKKKAENDPFGSFASNEMTYEVTVKTQWNSVRHPGNYPGNAHFSAPVVWTGSSNPVFSLGSKASPGMQEIAETGNTRILKLELEKLQEQNRITDFIIGKRLEPFTEESYRVALSRDKSTVSLVSALMPSPDWFVAIEGINLVQDGRWQNSVTLQALTLDAGTDDGEEFTASNAATLPQGTIGVLTDVSSQSMRPFAIVEFKRIGYEKE